MGAPRDLTSGHRWTCPVCGASRVTKFIEFDEGDDATRARAERALLAHIHSSVDGGHGPRNSTPDGVTDETLAESIDPVRE